MKPKVFFLALFLNECELLEVVLNEYWRYVDYFVIAEADHTITGLPKHLILERNLKHFNQYKDKLINLKFVNCSIPNLDFVWEQEKRLRDSILVEINHLVQPDDIIIYADIDELTDQETFGAAIYNLINAKKPQVIKCVNRMYTFDYEHPEKTKIFGPYFQFRKNIETIHTSRLEREHYEVIDNGRGWHFQNLGGSVQLLSECVSTAHLEDAKFWEIKESELAERIKNGDDLKGNKYLPVPLLEQNFPFYVWDSRERFGDLFVQNV
jgi:hypothetical protein